MDQKLRGMAVRAGISGMHSLRPVTAGASGRLFFTGIAGFRILQEFVEKSRLLAKNA